MSSLFGSAPAAPAETCMSLQASSPTRPQSQSFEVRIADYRVLYRSTGRPPPSCPQYPPDPAARAAQGLPPLFVPAPFPGTAGPSPSAVPGTAIFGPGYSVEGAAAGTSARVITDSARLPLPQTFVVPVAAAPEYAHWSHEAKDTGSDVTLFSALICSSHGIHLPALPSDSILLGLPETPRPRLPAQHARPAPRRPRLRARGCLSSTSTRVLRRFRADARDTLMSIAPRISLRVAPPRRQVHLRPNIRQQRWRPLFSARRSFKPTPRPVYNAVHARRPRAQTASIFGNPAQSKPLFCTVQARRFTSVTLTAVRCCPSVKPTPAQGISGRLGARSQAQWRRVLRPRDESRARCLTDDMYAAIRSLR
ncbi:hypothetical protein K438DRAFT_1776539 [Mycena galopus ATCC 62051]|nr:hypothetical protein K438DRAFT_1776539 [Mycena galopus ATCC 62051]